MTNKNNLTKADRKELLGKLESIIKILNDKKEEQNAIPTLRETVDLSMLLTGKHASSTLPNSSSNTDSEPQAQKSHLIATALPNQQRLFAETTNSKKNAASVGEARATKMKNPFLPQHIRTRFYDEDSSVDSLENSTDEGNRNTGSVEKLHDSIIDNVIAFYLPKIEADLRRRLKALAAKETHTKT